MSRKIVLFLSILIFLFSLSIESSTAKKKPKDLPEKHRKWLEEEVNYIIKSRERDVFLQLETDKEREIFIEAFWKQRDPSPGSPENEFRKEHYRRIAYVNKFFGRETTRPGWMTDRGRIYIILGDPIDVDRYENAEEHYPMIVWFYQGDVKYGLPSFFNVAFFKRRGIGEYILYSPVQDGPQNLLRNYYGDLTDYEAAYEKLQEYDPILAQVSLTLIPSERPFIGHPSLASETMMGNVFQFPKKKIDDLYAEKLLKYKDMVEVDYTANYIGSDNLVTLMKDPSDIYFVHFSIDPRTLSVGSFEDKYYSNFELVAQISDFEGKTVFQYQKTYSLSFDEAQLKDIKVKSYSIQDMFPLIPGQYKLSVLLKNTVSKEFTSFEVDISVPEINSLVMTPLILGYKMEQRTSAKEYIKPFAIGRYQLFCQPINAFITKENLIAFFQIHGLSQDLEEEGSIKFTFFKEDVEFMAKIIHIKEADDKINCIQTFPLQNFPPGYYTLKTALIDREGNEILYEKKEFTLSAVQGIARPWVISKATPMSHSSEYSFILGSQFLNKGEVEKAKTTLEPVFRTNPLALKYAHGFSRTLFLLKDYEGAKEVLKPFTATPQENYEFLSLLGKSCQALKEYEKAIEYYKGYLDHIGTNLLILNSIGECYFLLGNNDEALIAWEKSLEIDPNQEKIKSTVRSIKEKNK